MATTQKYYSRGPLPALTREETLALPQFFTLPDASKEVIYASLQKLDGLVSPKVEQVGLIKRFLVTRMQLTQDEAGEVVASYLGFENNKQLRKAKHTLADRRNTHIKQAQHQEKMRLQKLNTGADKLARQEAVRAQKKATSLALHGAWNVSNKGSLKGMFFYRHPEYLHAIEALLTTYQDAYLIEAVKNYPEVMEWDRFAKSFGVFWMHVQRLETQGLVNFSEPGLILIKRLARLLYVWNFRRYLSTEVIWRHARFLPVAYRADHVAAKLDTHHTVIVDAEYEELEMEEEDDNVGNR